MKEQRGKGGFNQRKGGSTWYQALNAHTNSPLGLVGVRDFSIRLQGLASETVITLHRKTKACNQFFWHRHLPCCSQ